MFFGLLNVNGHGTRLRTGTDSNAPYLSFVYLFIRKCIFIHIARSKLQESRDGIIDSFFSRKYALYFEV